MATIAEQVKAMSDELMLDVMQSRRRSSDDDDRSRNSSELEEVDEGDEDWDSWRSGIKEHKGCARPERWAPLGAANDSDKEQCSNYGPSEDEDENDNDCTDPKQLKQWKEDQEQLTSALLALTTHFAQVQFRVQQIVIAPQDEKEILLKDLEEFTFRGIPSAVTDRLVVSNVSNPDGSPTTAYVDDIKDKMRIQREKQKDLIHQLKNQLEDLEAYAYETGEAGLPQSVVLEKHKLVIEQLRDRLNLDIDRLETLSAEELKLQVDTAISEFVSPIKMKEELVNQLKTQIVDLERFIVFLHGETGWDAAANCTCSCPKHKSAASFAFSSSSPPNSGNNSELEQEEELRNRTIQMMKKALTLVQMFAEAQFGCSANGTQINTLRKNAKGNHWGDSRARLEVAIAKVFSLVVQVNTPPDSDYTSDCEDSPSISCNQALTSAVRKDLTVALAELIEHGLMPVGQSQSLVPFVSCFPNRSKAGSGFLSAWDLILKFYQLKNGEKYNATPARRLSQSFGLEVVGSTAITNKQMLLSTIDNIISSHSRYKRSPESHFKAFVCSALNSRKLVVWLRLIVRCQGLIEQYYQPWSYVAKTGFEDSFRSLEKLSNVHFDLPVDLAIRQFQNIKDAFQ